MFKALSRGGSQKCNIVNLRGLFSGGGGFGSKVDRLLAESYRKFWIHISNPA